MTNHHHLPLQRITQLILALLAGTGLVLSASAQRIAGYVVDARTGHPIENVHVFIASSMIGTATNAEGTFLLPTVPPGAHRLYVSSIGYAHAHQDTLLRPAQTYTINFRLEPTVVELNEVVVSAREARRWQRQRIKFERFFLGETDNATLTTIHNPEVLTFTSGWGRLVATASQPLDIENRALGYRITYFLREFEQTGNTIKYDGEPLFEELEPTSEEEAARWEANREQAFLGSQRHYLLSILKQRWKQEGFETYRRRSLDRSDNRFRVDPAGLLKSGPTPQEKELGFHGFLEVVYVRATEDEAYQRWLGRASPQRPGLQRSWLKLNAGPTLVDQAGEIIDPYGVVAYGYFAFERAAEEIPMEYRPKDWVTH